MGKCFEKAKVCSRRSHRRRRRRKGCRRAWYCGLVCHHRLAASLLQQPELVHRANITAARRLRQRFHSACKLRPSLGSRRLAMKLVVALALPAAALRPVQVTMSAAQNRRAFVIGGTAAAAAAATKANAYSLPDLPYAYDALEPSIDAATMKFHHGALPAYRDVASRESAAPRRRRDPSQTSTTRPTSPASTASSTRRTSRRLLI